MRVVCVGVSGEYVRVGGARGVRVWGVCGVRVCGGVGGCAGRVGLCVMCGGC